MNRAKSLGRVTPLLPRPYRSPCLMPRRPPFSTTVNFTVNSQNSHNGTAHTASGVQQNASDSTTRASNALHHELLSLPYFLELAKPHWQLGFVGSLALFICASCNLLAPVISGFLFECLVMQHPVERFTQFMTMFLVVYVTEPLLTQVYIRSFTNLGEKVLERARVDVYKALMQRPVAFYDRHSAAELTSLVASQLNVLREVGLASLSRDRGPRAFLESVGSIVIIFLLSVHLAPVLATVILVSSLGAAFFGKKFKKVFTQDVDVTLQLSEVAQEALGHIKAVKANQGEGMEVERFARLSSSSSASGSQLGKAKGALEGLNRGAVHVSLLALYGYGGVLAAQGLLPVRSLLSAIGFTFSLVFSTQGVVNTGADWKRASAALVKIQSILRETEKQSEFEFTTTSTHTAAKPPAASPDRTPLTSPSSSALLNASTSNGTLSARHRAYHEPIALRDVSFSYPSSPSVPVLSNVTLTLKPGTVTALVGRSGAGKSTVASLLAGFYSPSHGSIHLGTDDIHKSYTRDQWAEAIALVPQDPGVFTGTVYDNIAYGRGGLGSCPQAVVKDAAAAAFADEFIERLPAQYDTVLGPRGVALSGGQRQRLSIARAIARDAPLLILDEATSSLDPVSEKLVQKALHQLTKGRTTLIIAHRLSTVLTADKIVVMGDGRVLEEGTHAELLARNGEYAQLVQSQSLTLIAP